MADDASWRTPAFRQSVVSKIEEVIRQSGMNTSRNSIEMENHVFQKAKNKEEYLGFVARLILHVREMNKNGTAMGGPGQNQAGPGMPDPINALQNMASQGTRNPMMHNNPRPMQPQMGMQMSNQPGGLMPNQMRMPGMQQMAMPSNSGSMDNQMPPQMNNQMSIQMQNSQMNQINPNQIQINVPNQIPGQMPMPGNMQSNIPGSMGSPMPNQMPNQMIANQNQMQKGIMMGNFPPRNPTPTQIFAQSPSSSVQSPAGLGQPPVPSPALVPSPGSNLMCNVPPRSVGMASSPGALNTPGAPGQSPMGAGMGDEQAYREKVRQLSKYIEPLKRMIVRIGSDDEKMSKMKKLLEILCNPQQRMPLETLIKCELVLEKLDFKRSDNSIQTTFKEHHVFKPLLEAVGNNLQSSVNNHTLHRTFGPTLDALFGPEIKLVPKLKKMKVEEPTSDIPDILQGEIARLDQRFKVSLDPNQPPGSKSIQLTCWLDDKHLPCVPPVSLVVPEDYPKSAPTCHMTPNEYNATQFLSAVQTALLDRIKKLPKHFSVSQLLDTWEMSVRQASAPNYRNNTVSTTTLLMGL